MGKGGMTMSRIGVLAWRWIFESGDAKRLAKQKQDLSDLIIQKDIAYRDDGDQGHLFDIYRLPDTDETAPVMINIHGGGLFASYKEVNANFNYEWARMGYRVVSISYRRIPETTLWHQIDDVMAALRYIDKNSAQLGLNTKRCFLTGDSAGALLCLFALAVNNSNTIRKDFGIQGTDIHFRACGLISIMIDTQRKGMLHALSDQVTGRSDVGKPYEKYLLNPASLIGMFEMPPVYQATSSEDLIREDSLKVERLLAEAGTEHILKDFAKGTDRKLVHVFPVAYPMYPESREVFREMDAFFRAHETEE